MSSFSIEHRRPTFKNDGAPGGESPDILPEKNTFTKNVFAWINGEDDARFPFYHTSSASIINVIYLRNYLLEDGKFEELFHNLEYFTRRKNGSDLQLRKKLDAVCSFINKAEGESVQLDEDSVGQEMVRACFEELFARFRTRISLAFELYFFSDEVRISSEQDKIDEVNHVTAATKVAQILHETIVANEPLISDDQYENFQHKIKQRLTEIAEKNSDFLSNIENPGPAAIDG